jgi:phosphate transport system substrate-binding protein
MSAKKRTGPAGAGRGIALVSVIAVAATTFAGCFGGTPADTITLNGAGATFPAPLYDKWQGTYTASVDTNVHINYQSVGSGAGITQITSKQVDFGASDAPMGTTEFANAPGIMHVPSALGAVLVVYNIPGVAARLNFTASTLARIFNGNLTMWNDADLVANNPDAGLGSVSRNITVVHRSDSSGTTFVFTSYLRKADPTNWTTAGAKGWPSTLGIGGSGNSGVASSVTQTAYSIGYVELAYVLTSSTTLSSGGIQNHDGNFVVADTASTNAAATGLSALPAGDASWTGIEILNQPGAGTYPIASMTYILIYKTQTDAAKGKALVDFLWWAVHDGGQNLCEPNGYAKLPASVVTHDEATLRMVKDSNGNQLHA